MGTLRKESEIKLRLLKVNYDLDYHLEIFKDGGNKHIKLNDLKLIIIELQKEKNLLEWVLNE